MTRAFWRLWGVPLLLALCTAVGLLAALLGDGWWDGLSAVMLGAPVLAPAWAILKRPRP